MNIDFAGRVRNIPLAASNALSPLFEAIVNSLDAVSERGIGSDGRIDVRLFRDKPAQEALDLGETAPLQPICRISVTDNGIGFNDANYGSFGMSDSTYKSGTGGKGIGRLLWLKAFEYVSLRSCFECEDGKFLREFEFELPSGVSNHEIRSSDGSVQTTVILDRYKEPYRSKCPKGVEAIADKIGEHCLVYLLLDGCPKLYVSDEIGDPICINDRVAGTVVLERITNHFKAGDYLFDVMNLRLASGARAQQQIHYCAHKRVVKSEKIAKKIPAVSGQIRDNDGRHFIYSAYVSGPFLDESVNQERTAFNIASEDDGDLLDEVKWADIADASALVAEQYLSPYTTPVVQATFANIRQYVETEAPQYLHILRRPQDLTKIPPDLTNDRLGIELCKIDQRIDLDIKEKARAIVVRSETDITDRDAVTAEISRLMEQVNDIGQSRLASHIVHRKIILDLLEKSLQINENGKYPPEKVIHSIVHPMRTSSDERLCSPETQNLWVIDERLSYHSYLASDKPFRAMDVLDSDSLDRPDLIIYNTPIVFREGESPFTSIAIIEFKRPVRDDYADDDNPIAQVLDEIDKTKGGKAKDINGRPITVNDGTKFYCYIIADLTPQLRRRALHANLRVMPDNLGYFSYHEHYNAWIEIIAFEKLLSDAKKRSRVLFEKLGIK